MREKLRKNLDMIMLNSKRSLMHLETNLGPEKFSINKEAMAQRTDPAAQNKLQQRIDDLEQELPVLISWKKCTRS